MTLPAPSEPVVEQIQILIVEDERVVARDLKDCLEHLGYRVPAIAGTSDEAIALIEAHRPNLVLMDIVLEDSERDGVETAQEIRDRFGIPVVYLTAHATPTVVERVKATEPFGYLVKPFRETDLWVTVETALKRYSVLLAHERDLAVERSQQLEVLMREMAELDRLKDDFLSTISHEMRTPLSNIKLAVQMLTLTLDQQGLLTPKSESKSTSLSKYLSVLQDETDQELLLVNNLLDIQQLQAKNYPLSLSLLRLQTWLPHIAEPFLLQAETRHQTLTVTMTPELPPVHTDSHVLTRILSELLDNACKHSPAGERILVKVQGHGVISQSDHDWISLEVCNSGVTIELDDQERIFDTFYRATGSDRWASSGTGLGLALVKKFTALIGGQITVSSPPGWVCFRVVLPV
ncbi:MAG: ATP-binding protein [Elainellaceae cyanobacterium]